jgi:hypothetical protein
LTRLIAHVADRGRDNLLILWTDEAAIEKPESIMDDANVCRRVDLGVLGAPRPDRWDVLESFFRVHVRRFLNL